jgi:dihydrofolate synthase/folylpolyglutamate synthase
VQNERQAIEWIHTFLPFGIKPGLQRIEWMLEKLGHPEKELNVVHIGGTNGKGSTVSFMRYMLTEAGYNVGTFTSPYIEHFRERIAYKGEPISSEELVRSCLNIIDVVEELKRTDLGSPTEFEVITVIAFDFFARVNPDIVLLEVGLGGRLDSTNIVTPLLSIITSIGHDHMNVLGGTLESIAYEKAGIIKPDIPAIVHVKQPEAFRVIQDKANKVKAPLFAYGTDFHSLPKSVTMDKQFFLYQSQSGLTLSLETVMKGHHQIENASMAIQAIEQLRSMKHYELSNDHIVRGIRNTTWIGRFEKISEAPLTFVDGAHNEEGMKALAELLALHFPTYKYRFVMAVTKEKEMKALLAPYVDLPASFTFTTFEFERAQKAEQLYEQAPVYNKSICADWKVAIRRERESCKANEMVIICGSLYFISKVRAFLLER